MSMNRLQGALPGTLSKLPNLVTLDVSWNRLNKSYGFLQSGSISLQEFHVIRIPFSNFKSLKGLILAQNELEGSLTQLLQQSPNLIKLDVSSNRFYGTLTEAPFRNLTNLKVLSLSSNSLKVNFSPWFSPSFQLEILKLRACNVGKMFPHWLRKQKNLFHLDLSDSGISDAIPRWFWNISSQLDYLNVSHNSITGSLPSNSLSSCEYVDLSSNRFYGTLPSFSKSLEFLDVSSNAFSGGITFLCGLEYWSLSYLDLSNNILSGMLPNCWEPFENSLYYLNLDNNNFSGSLTNSIGSLSGLWSLRLRNNNFSGDLPESLENCSRLILLDLGENQFSGTVPDWIGTSPTQFIVLRLNSNKFEGNIPSTLCSVNNIQILDLSFNNISGTIPSCLNNFTSMANSDGVSIHRFYPGGFDEDGYVIEISNLDDFTALVFWKGHQVEFKNANKNIELLNYIDLSSNRLSGLIPEELTSHDELVVLNMSNNGLSGPIPTKIGQMRMLESLDLSHNLLSGEIPSSFANLSTLSYLNLSYNNLTGSIPVSAQLTTFDATTFMGNQWLCGAPLPNLCHESENVDNDLPNNKGGEGHDNLGMYICMVFGFIVGFWGVCGTLLMNKFWARSYFGRLTHLKERFHVVIMCCLVDLRRKFAC